MNLRKEIREALRETNKEARARRGGGLVEALPVMKYHGRGVEGHIQKIKQLIPDAIIKPAYCEYIESTIITGPVITINLDTSEVSSSDYGPMRRAQGGIRLMRKIRAAFPDNEVSVEFSESGMQPSDEKANIDIHINPKGYNKAQQRADPLFASDIFS